MFENKIDSLVRIFLYILVFWLPYSPAVVEVCVGVSLTLWLIKRSYLAYRLRKKDDNFTVKQWIGCYKPKESALDLPILLFLLVGFVSALASPLRGHSVHGFFSKTFEWFIVYYLFLEAFKERKHINIAFSVLLITTMAVCLDAFIQYFLTGKDIFNKNVLAMGRATASFDHSNSLGGYLGVLLPLLISLFFIKKSLNKNMILWVSCTAVLGALFLTFSRGAILAAMAGLLYVLFRLKRKWFFGLSCVIAIVFSLIYLTTAHDTKERTRFQWHNVKTAAQWRIKTWEESLRMVKERPLLGHGPNTFMRLFQDYRDHPTYRGKPMMQYDYGPTFTHNCYLQIAAEMGIIGLVFFLWIILNLFRTTRPFGSGFESIGRDSRFILIGLTGGIVVFLAQSFVDTNFYSLKLSVYFWAFVGILVSISQEMK